MQSTSERDLVCGMEIDPATAVAVQYEGDIYHFCEAACADTFRDDPDRWIRAVPSPSAK